MVPKVIAFFFENEWKVYSKLEDEIKKKSPTQDHAVKKIDLIDC